VSNCHLPTKLKARVFFLSEDIGLDGYDATRYKV